MSENPGILFDGFELATSGYRPLELPAGSLQPSKTSGCTAANTYEIGVTNKKTITALTFAVASDSFAEISLRYPDVWDRLTLKFRAQGYSVVAEDENDVITFTLQGLAVGHNDDADAAYGTAQTSIITVGASPSATKHLISSVSDPITIAGSPIAGDEIMLRLGRDVATAGTDGSQSFYLTRIVIQWWAQRLKETPW